MAERQQTHRMSMESNQLSADSAHRDQLVALQKQATKGTFVSDYLGQAAGFVIAVLCVVVAAYCAIALRDPITTAIFLGLPVIGIIKAVRGVAAEKKSGK